MIQFGKNEEKLRRVLVPVIWALVFILAVGLIIGGFFAYVIYDSSGWRAESEPPADTAGSPGEIGRFVSSMLVVVQNEPISNANAYPDMIFIVSYNALTQELTCAGLAPDIEADGAPLSDAYFSGGPKALIDTVNSAFGLYIPGYVCMDTAALASMIDLLGGVRTRLTQEEADYIVSALSLGSDELGAGENLLSGTQCMVHALDSLSSGRSFEPVYRRLAIIDSAVANMRQTATKESMLPLLSLVMSSVKTNMDIEGIRGFAYEVLKADEIELVSIVIPCTKSWEYVDGVLSADLEKNGKLLYESLYRLP